MRWIDILRLRLRSLFRRSCMDRELEDELRFHIETQIQQNLAAGMTPEQARVAARREFGNPALHQDECRDTRGITLIENFLEDFRHAVRGLRRDTFLACAATATLAIAIGATTTVFSIADSILIRPLPYPNADRIDWISEASGPTHEEIAVARISIPVAGFASKGARLCHCRNCRFQVLPRSAPNSFTRWKSLFAAAASLILAMPRRLPSGWW
jgi:hypothetical protein